MALRHREPLPIPQEDLVAIHGRLAPSYGSQLWEGDGRRVLVARVPGDMPDYVNDMERVVESAAPSDISQADRVLLVAGRQVHQVPVAPLRALMADRVAFDRGQCQMLRTQLPGALAHTFYRSPEDPRRRLRLAVRLPLARVEDIDDETLDDLVDQLGPRLETGFQDVHCVYLIAAEDDVRLDTDLFLQDLLARWTDEDRRRRVEAERARKAEAERRQLEKDRLRLVADLEDRYGPRVAYGPMRGGPHSRAQREEGARHPARDAGATTPAPGGHADRTAAGGRGRVDPAIAHIRDTVDSLPTPRSQAMTEAVGTDEQMPGESRTRRERKGAPAAAAQTTMSRETAAAGPPGVHRGDVAGEKGSALLHGATARNGPPGDERARIPPATGSPRLDQAVQRLAAQGYDILVRPPVEGHRIDVAAERADGYPQRVIVVEHERLRLAEADALLAAARDLDVDLALAVCDAVEPEAQRRIVATKVKVLKQRDLEHLDL